MAENAEFNELNPFLNNLEDSPQMDSVAFRRTGPATPAPISQRRDRSKTTQEESRSFKTRAKGKKVNWGSLVLSGIILFGLGSWWLYAYFFPRQEEFQLPIIQNKITIDEPVVEEVFLPEENIQQESIQPLSQIDRAKLGKGNYFIELQPCDFNNCVKEYKSILDDINLPYQVKVKPVSYKFVRLVSQQALSPEKAALVLDQLQQATPTGIQASTQKAAGGRSQVVLGLFTTLQMAKEVKLEAEEATRVLGLGFDIELVTKPVNQQQVYAGPFADEPTAKLAVAELKTLSGIHTSNLVQLAEIDPEENN